MHSVPLHLPLTQLSEQQSVATLHVPFAAVHDPMPPAHVCVLTSQIAEQQSELPAQVVPFAPQVLELPSPPPLPSTSVVPSPPAPPSPGTAVSSLPQATIAPPIAKKSPQRTASAFHVLVCRDIGFLLRKAVNDNSSTFIALRPEKTTATDGAFGDYPRRASCVQRARAAIARTDARWLRSGMSRLRASSDTRINRARPA